MEVFQRERGIDECKLDTTILKRRERANFRNDVLKYMSKHKFRVTVEGLAFE